MGVVVGGLACAKVSSLRGGCHRADRIARDDSVSTPPSGYRPVLGRKPVMPQNAAGMRVDPPVSVPKAKGTTPRAIAAALPPDDPPATRAGSKGLRTGP